MVLFDVHQVKELPSKEPEMGDLYAIIAELLVIFRIVVLNELITHRSGNLFLGTRYQPQSGMSTTVINLVYKLGAELWDPQVAKTE